MTSRSRLALYDEWRSFLGGSLRYRGGGMAIAYLNPGFHPRHVVPAAGPLYLMFAGLALAPLLVCRGTRSRSSPACIGFRLDRARLIRHCLRFRAATVFDQLPAIIDWVEIWMSDDRTVHAGAVAIF